MEDCSICLEPIQIVDKNFITVHCCNHTFHIRCYMKCMELKKECPLCRKDFVVHIETNNPNIPIVQVVQVRSNDMLYLRRCVSIMCFACIISVLVIFIYQRSPR